MTSAFYLNNKLNLETSWLCPSCNNVSRRVRNDNTPVRRQFQQDPNETIMSIDDTLPNDKSLSPSTLNVNSSSTSIAANIPLSLEDFSKLLDSKLEKNNKSIVNDLKNTIQSEINNAIANLKENIYKSTNKLSEEQESLKINIINIKKRVEKLEAENEDLKKQLQKSQEQSSVQLPDIERNKKIVLYGLTEYPDEPENYTHDRIINIFQDLLNVNLLGYVEDLKRLGRRLSSPKQKPRPLVIELISKKMTKYLLQNGRYFRNTGLAISEYLDDKSLQTRRSLQENLRSARLSGHHAVIRHNTLIINGKTARTLSQPRTSQSSTETSTENSPPHAADGTTLSMAKSPVNNKTTPPNFRYH